MVTEGLRPIRERYTELMKDQSELDDLLYAGAERAAEEAGPMLARVRERVGLLQSRVKTPASS